MKPNDCLLLTFDSTFGKCMLLTAEYAEFFAIRLRRVLQIWFYTIKYKLTNEGKKYQIKIKKYLTRGKDLNILYPLKGNNK